MSCTTFIPPRLLILTDFVGLRIEIIFIFIVFPLAAVYIPQLINVSVISVFLCPLSGVSNSSPLKSTTTTIKHTYITASTINSVPLMNLSHHESTTPTTTSTTATDHIQQQPHLHPHAAATDMNTSSNASAEQQQQNTSGASDALSESTIEQMRQQVMQQRVKVEEERYDDSD